jgi:putative ABC transport system substrate-binding protein
MKRRNFILALGGAVSVWPATGRAQRSNVPTIGFLSPRSPDDSAHLVVAFRRGLGETGLTEGQNVSVEYRWALGEYTKLPMLAAELVRSQIDVLVAVGASRPCWPPKPRPQRYQSSLYSLATPSKVA